MADDLFPPVGKVNINKYLVKAGTPLYRIHREKYAGDAFNDSPGGDARFSPIFDQHNNVITTIYAGDTTKVALCEVPLHDVDFSQQHIEFNVRRLVGLVHTELLVNTELQLAALDQPGLAKMRASKKVAHCDATDYQITRKWAEAIHEQHQDIHGLIWPSKQHPGNAYILFGDRLNGDELSITGNRVSVIDKSVLLHLFELADEMGITLLEDD